MRKYYNEDSASCFQRPAHPELNITNCTYKGSLRGKMRSCIAAEFECPTSASRKNVIFLAIHADYHSGFFAKLHSTLNQIVVAETLGFHPYVQWAACTHHFWAAFDEWKVDHYFDGSRGSNIFEYFFQPLYAPSRSDSIVIELSREAGSTSSSWHS